MTPGNAHLIILRIGDGNLPSRASNCGAHLQRNPAVVEQQIGRVDRLGSRWEQLVEATDESSWRGDPPRIKILPTVFKGTYDEHQWPGRASRRPGTSSMSLVSVTSNVNTSSCLMTMAK